MPTGTYKRTKEHNRNISIGLKRIGHRPPPNTKTGKECPSYGKRGTKAHAWKGEKAGYHAIHLFIRRKYGRPKKCERCGIKTGKIEWSNISGKYSRARKDWRRLCVKCHRFVDKWYEKVGYKKNHKNEKTN